MSHTIRRRRLLAAGAIGLLAGCYGNVSCTSNVPQRNLSDEFYDEMRFGNTESNVTHGGDCSRRTRTFCIEVSITGASKEVHTVEARTPSGETVSSREVRNGSVEHLQIAEYEPNGQRVEREIVLLDDDEQELDSTIGWYECEAS